MAGPYRYRHGWIPLAGTIANALKPKQDAAYAALAKAGDERVKANAAARAAERRAAKTRRAKASLDTRPRPKLLGVSSTEGREQAGDRSYPVITASQLSTSDARRSPEVSAAEFQAVAKRGEAKLAALKGSTSEPTALQDGPGWDAIIDKAFRDTREPWGGITVDAHSGEYVAPDADKYALTARDEGHSSVTVSPDASIREFYAAMFAAREQFADELARKDYHLGVFHDQDTGQIEIDPVIVTSDLKTAQEIGAFTRALGGAFHFKSGDGFWPPHVTERVADDTGNTQTAEEIDAENRARLGLKPGEAPVKKLQAAGFEFANRAELAEFARLPKAAKTLYAKARRTGKPHSAAMLVAREADMSTSYITPEVHDDHLDLASEGGKLAFWKQILPMRRIAYTAKDGTRRTLDFTRDMLTELAGAKGVDKLGFLLADKDNRHTMDPDRWRGEVAELAVRDDGLYGKIVFPNADAAKAVIDNPDLGVSARIRENVQRDDGRTIPRALIHVLGTLDPQVGGMSPWQSADLSTEQDEVLDLSDEEYTEMPKQAKALADYTEADIDAMTETELDAFLAEHAPDFDANAIEAEADEGDEVDDPAAEVEETERAKELVDASKDGDADIELANQRADRAEKRANEALRRQAAAEWQTERAKYLGEGVPAASLDLAAPLLNRADDMVIDLSSLDEDDVNVSQIVRGLLDGQKGTVDLSDEQGHSGHFNPGEGEDPDAEALAAWDKQF